MKSLVTIFTITLTIASLSGVCAQSTSQKAKSSQQERTYQRKTSKHRVTTADSSDLGAILKDSSNAETGPILNDNGNVNSTGSVDGSRSSTGRPDADTSAYTVKKKKTVIRSGYANPGDNTSKKKP